MFILRNLHGIFRSSRSIMAPKSFEQKSPKNKTLVASLPILTRKKWYYKNNPMTMTYLKVSTQIGIKYFLNKE